MSGLLFLVGCSPSGGAMGVEVGEPTTSLAAIGQASAGTQVTVTGKMVEKCPEAGCWFVLEDGGTRLRVDTKMAGFVVVEIPLNRMLTVTGQLTTNANHLVLSASGVRF